MQIDGFKEFTTKITSSFQNVSAGNKIQNSILYPSHDSDTFNISEIGKRLRYNGMEGISRLIGKSQIIASDSITSLMDESISNVEEIFTKMHILASKAAENNKLSDLDRINMQIEMEDMRKELAGALKSMDVRLAEMAGYRDQSAGEVWDANATDVVMVEARSAKGNGGGTLKDSFLESSVLERARDRIEKGQSWDIAEGVRQHYTIEEVLNTDLVTIKPDEDGIIRWTEGEKGLQITDSSSPEVYALSETKHTVTLDDGTTVTIPTVREKLEASGTIILMDAESAKKGVKRLESELGKLQAMRNELETFETDPQKNRNTTVTEVSSLKAKYSAMLEALQKKEKEENKELGYEELTSSTGEFYTADKTELFLTEIGIMKTDSIGRHPILVSAANPKGEMFAKLGRFFKSLASDFTKAPVDENLYATDMVITNVIRTPKVLS